VGGKDGGNAKRPRGSAYSLSTASWLMNPPPEAEEVVDDVVPVHPTRIALSRRATAATVKRNNLPIGALSIYAEDGAGAWNQPHPLWRASVVERTACPWPWSCLRSELRSSANLPHSTATYSCLPVSDGRVRGAPCCDANTYRPPGRDFRADMSTRPMEWRKDERSVRSAETLLPLRAPGKPRKECARAEAGNGLGLDRRQDRASHGDQNDDGSKDDSHVEAF
jgi:hypothetical protein